MISATTTAPRHIKRQIRPKTQPTRFATHPKGPRFLGAGFRGFLLFFFGFSGFLAVLYRFSATKGARFFPEPLILYAQFLLSFGPR